MREIKFRVVDTLANKVHTGKEIYDFEKAENEEKHSISGLDIVKGCEIGGFSNIILQQYTGLKDKNGKEIYEGDVVTGLNCTREIYIGVVTWNDDTAGFHPLGIHSGCGDKELREIEVIGNIYENPELINN